MRTTTTTLAALAGLMAIASILPQAARAAIVVNQEDVHWTTVGDFVQFDIRFHNSGPEATPPGTTDVYSQPFGVFASDYGHLGTFNVPPMQPNSFFDVFFEVPLADLPPSADSSEPIDRANSGRDLCTPDDHWDGNVDIQWFVGGEVGQVNYHVGTLLVCPDGGNSFIHILDFCPGVSTWSFIGVCPGWSAALMEEDQVTPAPANLPPMWTGWIRLSADGSVNEGDTCNPSLVISCGGQLGTITLEAVACVCGPVPVAPSTWSSVKTLY
jgi:hypothetical protein